MDLHERKPAMLKLDFQHDLGKTYDDIGEQPSILAAPKDYAGEVKEDSDHGDKSTLDVSASAKASHDAHGGSLQESEHEHAMPPAPHASVGRLEDLHWFWYLTGMLVICSGTTTLAFRRARRRC